jgi:hypothetical protein
MPRRGDVTIIIDDAVHMIIHDLIETEDVRGCFDERAS